MFRADVIVFELARFGLSGIERFLEFVGGKQIAAARALDFMAAVQFRFHVRLSFVGGTPIFRATRARTFRPADEREQQMLPTHGLVRKVMRDPLASASASGFDGQLVQLHTYDLV